MTVPLSVCVKRGDVRVCVKGGVDVRVCVKRGDVRVCVKGGVWM